MNWKQLLVYITGSVDQELLLRNEYLVTENRLLCKQLQGRIRLSDGEQKTPGKRALEEIASFITLDTILAWHRTLIAQKFDGSQQRKALGQPRVSTELEALVMRIVQENRSWGHDHITTAAVWTTARFVTYYRDGNYCPALQRIIDDAGVQRMPLPPRSRDLNAYAEP